MSNSTTGARRCAATVPVSVASTRTAVGQQASARAARRQRADGVPDERRADCDARPGAIHAIAVARTSGRIASGATQGGFQRGRRRGPIARAKASAVAECGTGPAPRAEGAGQRHVAGTRSGRRGRADASGGRRSRHSPAAGTRRAPRNCTPRTRGSCGPGEKVSESSSTRRSELQNPSGVTSSVTLSPRAVGPHGLRSAAGSQAHPRRLAAPRAPAGELDLEPHRGTGRRIGEANLALRRAPAELAFRRKEAFEKRVRDGRRSRRNRLGAGELVGRRDRQHRRQEDSDGVAAHQLRGGVARIRPRMRAIESSVRGTSEGRTVERPAVRGKCVTPLCDVAIAGAMQARHDLGVDEEVVRLDDEAADHRARGTA